MIKFTGGDAVLGRSLATIGAAGMVLAMSVPAQATDATRASFGALADGTPIEKVTLTNGAGVSATVMTLGATLQSLIVPDRQGKPADVVLGYDTAAEYLANPQYFGASVGRFANRVAKGRFSLDGKQYTLETNDGPNHLHGGIAGFDKRVWSIMSVKSGPEAEVVLGYRSPDGEGGYPGTLLATAAYSLNEANELRVEYRAETDKPTIVNLTNHALFNLAGEGSALGHLLTMQASRYTPVDETLIPTGELAPVEGTPFDFRKATRIEARIRDGKNEQIRIGRGYDHNFVIDGEFGAMRPVLRLEDPHSGRVMEIDSTSPGLQFYSGNFLNGTVIGKGGQVYRQGDGHALEPQGFPDAPNQTGFPSARLNPGQKYSNVMIFRFSTSPE
jgi:aldose 1-epimerase